MKNTIKIALIALSVLAPLSLNAMKNKATQTASIIDKAMVSTLDQVIKNHGDAETVENVISAFRFKVSKKDKGGSFKNVTDAFIILLNEVAETDKKNFEDIRKSEAHETFIELIDQNEKYFPLTHTKMNPEEEEEEQQTTIKVDDDAGEEEIEPVDDPEIVPVEAEESDDPDDDDDDDDDDEPVPFDDLDVD